MRKSLIATAAVATLVATALVASASALGATSHITAASHSTKVIAFTATYSGTATTKVADNIADIVANGSGTGTLLGASKITGKGTGDTSAPESGIPFQGPGTIIGVAGTKLLFTVLPTSRGTGDESGQMFSLNGKAKVTKGFGKLKNAKGTLKLTGSYDRGAGTFKIKLTGSLTA